MSDNSSSIVSKVWNYAHVLKNAGVGYGDYVEQITYLLFDSDQRSSGFAQTFGLPLSAPLRLKLAPSSLKLRRTREEMSELGYDPASINYAGTSNPIPTEFAWSKLRCQEGDNLQRG